ncbi:hypothetical protein [Mucilaginibacter sp.]
MINYTRLLLVFLFTGIALGAAAQSTATNSSPYSRYGVGLLNDQVLPINRGMGGIGAATNQIGGYSTINPLNPASYSAFGRFTVFEIGVNSNNQFLSQNGVSGNQSNSNFRLSHFAFGAPVSKHSGLSFGLTPYSEVGYNYTNATSRKSTGTAGITDTAFNTVYYGDGGLSKAYLGYGFGIGKHLKLGANVSYIFGNLHNFSSIEFPTITSAINSRAEESRAIGGVNYDYGAQYSVDFGDVRHLTFGYSASGSTKLNSKETYVASQYLNDATGNENVALDTLTNIKGQNAKLTLPLIQHFGISFQNDRKFLIGADYSTGKWSNYAIDGVSQGLRNSESFRVGGQITPNVDALRNYFARMDYRLGFKYDKTNLNVLGTDIKAYAATFGLGFPLPRNNNAFYKINFSAELGQRGTLQNNLIKEKFINLHLSFTLNDVWFVKYRFD